MLVQHPFGDLFIADYAKESKNHLLWKSIVIRENWVNLDVGE